MNKYELKKKLMQKKVNSASYCLDGGLPSEQYCLDENYGKWYVYYSERGSKIGLREFLTEKDACEHFYNITTKDPTVYR